MEDFAAVVKAGRTRLKLTQAELAAAAGMTASYLSFLENRKKPPPSDRAIERLAGALRTPASALLALAHLERAPRPLQQRVAQLSRTLRRERRSRLRTLHSLLPPLLGGPPDLLQATLSSVRIPEGRRRRLREVLRALGRERIDEAARLARALERLPTRDRRVLLEAIPAIAGSTMRKPRPGRAPLRYDAPDDGEARVPYELRAERDHEEAQVRAGDLLAVDPGLSPREGDWVVLRGAEGPLLRKLVRSGGGWLLAGAPARDAGPPLDDQALAATLARLGAGVLTEIRRSLRPRR